MNKITEMQMTGEQYRRVNRYALTMLIAIQGLLGALTLLHLIFFGFPVKDIVLIVALIFAIGIDIVGFLAARESKMAMVIYLIVWTVAYALTVFLGSSTPIVLLFPVLVVFILYLNPLAVAGAVGSSLLIHLIKLIVMGVTGQLNQANTQSSVMEFLALIVMCIGIYAVTRLLMKNMYESQEQITVQAEQQMAVAANVEQTATTINQQFETITNQIVEIVTQVEGNNQAITNIAESTEATAEAIQEQMGMTNDIKECIDVTAQNANDIIDTTDQLYDVVSEGIEVVEGLQEQTEMVNVQTNETTEAIQKLVGNVDEVHSITKAILDISSQTNLLALNASIEAARAGEAGKGFAVVADEIRNLAEQTKASTEQITKIINDLTAVTKESMSKLQVTVDSVHEQAEMVEKVNTTFMETCKCIDELKEYTGSISDNVDTVVEANNRIIDSISQLSASAEEVSSSSQEGMAVSNVILEQVQDFASAVEEMSGMIGQLATSITSEVEDLAVAMESEDEVKEELQDEVEESEELQEEAEESEELQEEAEESEELQDEVEELEEEPEEEPEEMFDE